MPTPIPVEIPRELMASSAPPRPHLRLVPTGDGGLDAWSDEALMEGHRDGLDGAFDVLVRRWRGPIFGYLRRLGLAPQRAEELVADTFLKIHRAAPRYTPSARFATYLHTVAYRAALNARDRMSTRFELPVGPDRPEPPGSTQPPDRALAIKRSFEALQTELDALPEGHRDAFVLYYAQGLSCAEVAQTLDITATEAKGRLAYARRLLRQRLPETP